MYAGSPVIAVASGGPLETIVDEETGFLCEGNGQGFAEAILKLVENPSLKKTMGAAGHAHVKASFGLAAFAQTLDATVRSTVRKSSLSYSLNRYGLSIFIITIILIFTSIVFTFRTQ